MNRRYHRRVPEDLAAVLDYYEREAGETVAEEFQAELMAVIDKVAADPLRFPPCGPRLRRANLDRFPYHFLFEVRSGYIYVTVLRHGLKGGASIHLTLTAIPFSSTPTREN